MVFGCRYTVTDPNDFKKDNPESIPVFCLGKTVKTRALFEIAKGSFSKDMPVDKQVNDLEYPFTNMIYIGDGPTDVPVFISSKK